MREGIQMQDSLLLDASHQILLHVFEDIVSLTCGCFAREDFFEIFHISRLGETERN